MTEVRLESGSWFERWRNRLFYQMRSPQFFISLVLVAVLAFLILVPLYGLVVRTFTWTFSDLRLSRDAVPGQLTTQHWERLLLGSVRDSFFTRPFLHTILTGGVSAVIAVLLGGTLAWLVARTDIPGRKWFRTLLTIPYVVPSFALALAWTVIFRSPRIGGQPGLFQAVFGIAPPDWLSYGPVPIIITLTIHFFPFALLTIMGALSSIDTQLEEQAEIFDASRWTILRKITFPIVAPAFGAALILTLGKTFSTFALPFLLGSPTGYYTLSTMLFNSLELGLEANGFMLATILILMTTVIVYVNSRFLGKKMRRFETIGGKGFKGNPTRLGKGRWVAFTLVSVFVLVTVIFPIGLLSYQSLMLIDGRFGLSNLTLHYWIGHSNPAIAFGEPGVFHNPGILGAAWNSIRLAIIASVICSGLGMLIGYIVVRDKQSRMTTFLNQVSFLPFLFPPVAFGAMYLSMFAVKRGPIPALYGTFTLLVLISVINRLPYTTRTGASAATQIGQELEEAAEIEGASWFQRFRQIVWPLALPGAVSGMLVSFVGIMRELSLILLLITPATRVLMTVGFQYAEEGLAQLSNALILMVTIITLVGQMLLWWLGRSKLSRLQER